MSFVLDLHKKKKDSTIHITRDIFSVSHDPFSWIEQVEQKKRKKNPLIRGIVWVLHFSVITSILFAILLLASNWSAYTAFARAILVPEELEAEKDTIESGLANTDLNDRPTAQEAREARRKRVLQKELYEVQKNTPQLGVTHFNQEISQVSLSVNIAPYDNRVIIPKIGKNIPLVNVEHHDAGNSNEWHKIFMKELENGVVKYPGSADPGNIGNSFIFWHSSNYPWAKWDYNDVFALLNKLENGDEIIVYFQQKKYVYVVKDKLVVKPGSVSSLGWDETHKQLTLMTCWPLGTTLNRLLVVTELRDTTETL